MKKEGWEQLLNDHIALAASAPFEWGTRDCALWSADWVRIATETDFATEWRGKYSTKAELRLLMERLGIRTPEEIADETGLKVVNVAFAQRGDIMLHPQGMIGICNGMWSFFLILDGLTRLLTSDCVKAWKVE